MSEVSHSNDAPDSDAEATDGSSGGETEVTLDVMFEILKNSRRRLVLEYLQGREGQAKLSDLADQVTAAENDTDVDSITSTERKRVYVGLYQFHLPKMDDMGIIHFDQDRGTVELAAKGRELLRAHQENNRPARKWHVFSFGLAAIGLVAAGATVMLGGGPLPLVIIVLQSLALVAFGLVQAYEYHGGFTVPFWRRQTALGSRFLENGGG